MIVGEGRCISRFSLQAATPGHRRGAPTVRRRKRSGQRAVVDRPVGLARWTAAGAPPRHGPGGGDRRSTRDGRAARCLTQRTDARPTGRQLHRLNDSSVSFPMSPCASSRCASAPALVLFGDRVLSTDLSVAAHPVPLWTGRGRDLVDRAANAAGITVVSWRCR